MAEVCSLCDGHFHPACHRNHISNCKYSSQDAKNSTCASDCNNTLEILINNATSHIIEKFTTELKYVKDQNILLSAAIQQLQRDNANMRTIINEVLSVCKEHSPVNSLLIPPLDTSTEPAMITSSGSGKISNSIAKAANERGNAISTNTYATALSANNSVVVITPTNNQTSSKTIKQISEKIKRKDYNVMGLKHGIDGKIIIRCADDETKQRLQRDAERELGQSYKVSIPKTRLPRLKIINIMENLTKDELYDCLINQNSSICGSSDLKVLHIAEGKNSSVDKFSAYIQVNGKSFVNIINEGFLNVGWERCRVFEDLKVMRCFNCSSFNHKRDKCPQQTPTCGKCAAAHSTSECGSELENCANCIYATNTLRLVGVDCAHPSWDRSCPSYQRMLNIHQSRINYKHE